MFKKCNCDKRLAHLETVVDALVFQPKWKKCCCGESEMIHRLDGPCYRIEQKPDQTKRDDDLQQIPCPENKPGCLVNHYGHKKPDPCTHDYGVLRVGCMPWCKGKPDPVEEFEKQLLKAAEECGKYVREQFEKLARAK